MAKSIFTVIVALVLLHGSPAHSEAPEPKGSQDGILRCGYSRALGGVEAGMVGALNGLGTLVVALGDAGTSIIGSPLYFSPTLRSIATDAWEFKDTRRAAYKTKARAAATYQQAQADHGCASDRRSKVSAATPDARKTGAPQSPKAAR